MTLRFSRFMIIGLISIMGTWACATEPTPPPVDVVGTMAAQMASEMLTQTVAAYSPTPVPVTPTVVPTETPIPEPTHDQSSRIVVVNKQAACWFGPGPKYALESYISHTKKVELLGVGSVEGWYVIMNPYFYQACWIAAEDLDIPSYLDLSLLPVITP
jgi:hypothetical protein